MINRKKNRSQRTKVNSKQPSRVRTYSLVVVCVLMLVSGFFFAARQHFSSMDYGMKNSRLRRQVDDLEAEKRRLMLAREISLSPAEIKKAAKKTGLLDSSVAGEIAQVVSTTKEKALPPPASDTKSLVIKTAAVSVAPSAAVAALAKKEKPKTTKPKATVD